MKALVVRFGARRAVLYGFSRLLDRVFGGRCRLVIYRLVAQPVAQKPLVSRPGKIEIRRIARDEVVPASFPRPAEVIRWRLRQGYEVLGAFRGEQMVGFIWLALDGYDEDEVRCRFEPSPTQHCAWDFDVFVRPEHRIGTCFARLWQAANEYLRERGRRWTMSRISYFNVESLAAHRRLGAVDLATAAFLVAGPVQVMVANCRPWLHFGLRPAQRPRVVLKEPASSPPPNSKEAYSKTSSGSG